MWPCQWIPLKNFEEKIQQKLKHAIETGDHEWTELSTFGNFFHTDSVHVTLS